MAFRLLCIIFVTLPLVSISVNNAAFAYTSNVTDHQALLSVKSWITGDSLGALSSWNYSNHFCQWKGVTCSHRRQRVTALDLSSQKLEGMMSPHIGNLTFLRLINFTDNSFHGYVPNEIGRLFRLQNLLLDSNSFQGGFPPNLSHCIDIRNISLTNNNLQGKLPTKFVSWSKLNVFNLGTNYFTGPIPPSIGNLSSLVILNLATNNLSGSIPLEVGNLLKLKIFQVSNNNLSGMVPLPLYNMSSIHVFNVDENQLTGMLPPDLGLTLPNLRQFLASFNKFSGPFPPSIANASDLFIFEILSNNISGPVPANLGNSHHNLEYLNLGSNLLGHKGDLSFFNSLVNCTSLETLGIAENGLRGELPNSIVNLSTTLYELDMEINYLHGSIPQEIGKLVNLEYLVLDYNNLTGSIPKSIGQLSKLGELYLNGNTISGEIPASISNITDLLILSLYSNMLHGSIPTALFNISTLLLLNLSMNRLTGVIPEQLSGLLSISQGLYLQQNLFTGPLPSTIESLKHIGVLSVSDNQLTGEIPHTLGDCSMLEELHMEGNFFEGRIPSSLKALKSLVLLDLSRNNISGNIPSFIGRFHLMQSLDLSHNRLEGEVPKEGVFSNVSAFSVEGNLQLCGGIQALHLPACPVISSTKSKHFRLRKIHLLVLLPIAIFLACFLWFFYRLRKSKLKNVTVSGLGDDKHPKLSYQDLLLATDEFATTSFLGKGRYGSVYRGILEPLRQVVAVKVLHVEVSGANKSFLAECEILRNICHRNLIKIITACSSIDFKGNDFKALVFEFMTNGSLDNWLHPTPPNQGNERNLTLLQRLNVAIDVASALDYLHHHSHTRIIHCDIKPSNILLDEEFVARVGDFGLARFVLADTNDISRPQRSSSGIRGTVGYVPPEYGMGGEISTNGDVYSFGILLLEIFSGKRPTGSSVSLENANNIHDYVKRALPSRVMDITDPRIIPEQEEHGLIANQHYNRGATEVCLATIFEVGILCSLETPHERIDINVALKQLHVARDLLLRSGE